MRSVSYFLIFISFTLFGAFTFATGEVTTGDIVTGNVIETTKITTQQISISSLYSHLDIQKNNSLNFLSQEQVKLQKSKQTALDIVGSSSAYDTLVCLDIPGLSDIKRDMSTSSISKAITDDYINLSSKIHKFEVNQKLGELIDEDDLNALNIQIINYGKNYQNTILQIGSKLESEFNNNTKIIKNFVTQNKGILTTVDTNKQIIENTINQYELLQNQLNSSRLLFGLTFQQITKTKDATKERFSKGFQSMLSTAIKKQMHSYPTFIGLEYELNKEIKFLSMQFNVQFDLWFNKLIGKFINNNSLEVLQTSISSVKQMYYTTGGNIQCTKIANLSENEKELLKYIKNEIIERGYGINIEAGSIDNETKTKRKKDYLQKLGEFYITTSKELIQDFNTSAENTINMYTKLISVESQQLTELNNLNERYRSIRDENKKTQIRNEILYRTQSTCQSMLHSTNKMRCEKVQEVMFSEQYGQQQDNSITTETNNNIEKPTNNPPSNQTETNTQDSNTEETSSNTNNEQVQNAVNQYIQDLEKKYPEGGERKAVIQVIIKNLEEKVKSETDTQLKEMYAALQKRLILELEKL